MKKLLLLALLLTGTTYASAQQTERFPLAQFEEWTDTKPHDDAAVEQHPAGGLARRAGERSGTVVD